MLIKSKYYRGYRWNRVDVNEIVNELTEFVGSKLIEPFGAVMLTGKNYLHNKEDKDRRLYGISTHRYDSRICSIVLDRRNRVIEVINRMEKEEEIKLFGSYGQIINEISDKFIGSTFKSNLEPGKGEVKYYDHDYFQEKFINNSEESKRLRAMAEIIKNSEPIDISTYLDDLLKYGIIDENE